METNEQTRGRLIMRFKFQILILTMFLGVSFIHQNLMAAGDGESTRPDRRASASFKAGQKAVKAEDYQVAIGHLKKAARKDPKNADIQNLLGYSYRKLGRFDEAFQHYEVALKLNPKHRGANEYLGELYLETDQLAKAEQRLKVLDKACFFGCEEYDDLKEAIEKYKSLKK
jgi:Tfp pilus assembly protein PilF